MAIKIEDLNIADSIWKDCKIIAEKDGFIVIVGNWEGRGDVLGAAWVDYPTVDGRLCPMVVPPPFAEMILNSLDPATVHEKALNKAKELLLKK